jgi:hypothetical protein
MKRGGSASTKDTKESASPERTAKHIEEQDKDN